MFSASFPRLLRLLLLGFVTLAVPASVVSAQPAASAGALSDRFQVDLGYFKIGSDTVLRYDGAQGDLGEVDFEEDLGLDNDAATAWFDGTWRLGRRHQLKLSYTKIDRERAGVTLDRTFTWGGQTYSAGLSASATAGNDILGGYYRFAAYRNDRFEIGPALGVGYLWLDAGIRATGTTTGPGGGQSYAIDESATLGSVTGAIGGYTNIWPTDRFVLRADYLYISVSPDNSNASVTDWRAGFNYYFTRHIGAGVQYKFYRYSYDRGVFESELGGELTFSGIQAFASFLF